MDPIILSIRPAPAGAGSRTVAHFDVQLGHVRLFGLLLREFADGKRRTIAPNAAGRHAATFHPETAEKITAAATAALGGLTANANRH